MDTIIGLGSPGCGLVEKFSEHSQYRCFVIDTERHSFCDSFLLQEQKSHESYEKNCPNIQSFLKNLTDDTLFILSGAGTCSGASLRLLEQINNRTKNISILYVKPDLSLLSETGKLQEKVVYNVLQEYARSGVFERMYVVDNTMLEEIAGEVSIINYYEQLNQVLFSAFNMINVFDHTRSISDTFERPHETSRLVSMGVVDLENKKQKMFFSLDKVRELRYYFAINENELSKNSSLFSELKEFVKSNNSEEIKASYGIYSTQYKQNFGYVAAYSSQIQK